MPAAATSKRTVVATSLDDLPIELPQALDYLEACVPSNRAIVTDGGRFIGEPIGACVARPGRPTLLVCGDGGFMYCGLAEFNTTVREKLDLFMVVCSTARTTRDLELAKRAIAQRHCPLLIDLKLDP